METFTHIDEYGNARMVDVSEKDVTSRRAEAEGYIGMSGECFSLLQAGKHKKGDVLTVAQVAGIMGTKQTAGLIPLCHSLALTGCKLLFYPGERPGEGKKDCYVRAVCQVECSHAGRKRLIENENCNREQPDIPRRVSRPHAGGSSCGLHPYNPPAYRNAGPHNAGKWM